jgi:ATP-binding protein involved in chromosome partitioning
MVHDPQATREQLVVSALETVRTPAGKNLIEAGLVLGVEGTGGALTVHCHHPGWPPPVRERIERDLTAALQGKMPQLARVVVNWRESEPSVNVAGPAPARPDSFQVKHVIAVGSGKGGVGKSTIAAAVAYALRHRGAAVGLMDADVYGPSIPHLLGLHGQPAIADNRYVPLQHDGIKCMSMGFLVPPNQSVIWRGPMLHKAVRDFLFLVDWGPLEYLIVDLPPGTGDVVLSLSQQLPVSGGVIVCTPQDVALLDARKALDMLRTVKILCRGIVENMSYFHCPACGVRSDIFGHGGAQRWATESGIPFLGAVPINLQIRINGDEGRIGECFAEDSPVRDSLMAIADRLVESLHTHAPAQPPVLEIVDG